MNREELERVLDLHKKAYELLLWIGQQAQHRSDVVRPEVYREIEFGEDCQEWVRRFRCNFPSKLQPAESDIRPFALLLSSFFRTSFHVEYGRRNAAAAPVLKRGAPAHGCGRAARRRDRKTTKDLQIIALKELAEAAGFSLSQDRMERLAMSSDLTEDLALWSYACELERRSRFSSQGPAVHRMWLDMSIAQRRTMSVQQVWQARERLLEALRGHADMAVSM